MPKFTFLHLSDLHYSINNINQERLLNAFFRDLENLKSEEGLRPDFVVFSGDLVNNGDDYKEFNAAKEKFLDRISTILQIDKTSIFIAPGNHDIQRKHVDEIAEIGLNKLIVNIRDIDGVIDLYDKKYKTSIKQRFSNYKKFIDQNGYKELSLSKNNVFSTFKIEINNTTVGIACLNSSLRATGIGGRHDYGSLIIGAKQINLVLRDLGDCDYKIANLHHPFDWITEIEKHDIKRILKREFDFILFGHNHTSSIDHVINPEYESIALNAPALYESSRSFVGYSIVQVMKNETKVHLRSYYKNREVFDIATDNVSNGIFTIKPQKKIEIEDAFIPKKYPLEEIKSNFTLLEQLTEEELFNELNSLKGKTFGEIKYQASSIVSYIISKNSLALKGKDLSNLCLKGTDFTGTDLTDSRFINTDISDTFFSDVILDNALFDSVDLTDAQFIEVENKRAVDFSEENQIVSGGSSGAIIYWDSKIILRGHRSSILNLRFSACKKYLASAHDNGMIFIWEPNQSIEPLKVLRKSRSPIYSLAWNPTNSDTIVSTGVDGSLNIWNWNTSEIPKETKYHQKDILILDWNINGKFLLSAGIDRKIIIHETSKWSPVFILPVVHKDYIRAVKWKNESYFASCSDDGKVCIWSWLNGAAQLIFTYEFHISVLSLAWHPILNILACGLRDDTVIFWDLENMSDIQSKEMRRVKFHTGRVWDVNWDKNGEYLASAGNEGKVILWKNCFSSETKDLYSENEIASNLQVLKMNFSCNNLKLKNLKGIDLSGYQTFKNKDRDWDVQECSLQDWLVNHGAELE